MPRIARHWCFQRHFTAIDKFSPWADCEAIRFDGC